MLRAFISLFLDNLDHLNKNQKAALKEIMPWKDKVIRAQDKRSGFVVLKTCDYVRKVEYKINISSFSRLDEYPSPECKQKMNNWLNK